MISSRRPLSLLRLLFVLLLVAIAILPLSRRLIEAASLAADRPSVGLWTSRVRTSRRRAPSTCAAVRAMKVARQVQPPRFQRSRAFFFVGNSSSPGPIQRRMSVTLRYPTRRWTSWLSTGQFWPTTGRWLDGWSDANHAPVSLSPVEVRLENPVEHKKKKDLGTSPEGG